MKREPVAIINAVIALIEAGIAVAVGFGLDWSGEQVALVMAAVVALGTVIKTILVREQVTPLADPRNAQGVRLVPESPA